MKLLFDIFLGFILLVLLVIPILLIVIAVRFTSKGPVLYWSDRIGKDNKVFKMPKFRSMRIDTPAVATHLLDNPDSYLSPIGGFLRRSSLDELPQFVNVIQGRMSVVGPRPHATAHDIEYGNLIPEYNQRFLVKPGITGLAQISGWRGETNTLDKMQKRINMDLIYINNWTLWLDIKIIFITMWKGFNNKNAY
jgi:putative colanic acid biosynthesis UDP-glucose lipid carrier transferase